MDQREESNFSFKKTSKNSLREKQRFKKSIKKRNLYGFFFPFALFIARGREAHQTQINIQVRNWVIS